MRTTWKLQDAKAKFSQIVEDAMKIEPQFVTRRGQKAVVIVSSEQYVRNFRCFERKSRLAS